MKYDDSGIGQRLKLHPRFTVVAFSFYMASIMAFLMCLIITAANRGVGPDFLVQVFKAYKLAMPSAFLCVLLVRPVVAFLVKMTVQQVRL